MMSKKKSLVSMVLVFAMFVTLCIPAMAASNQTITLPVNQAWVTAGSDTRTGKVGFVNARNHSVYPTSGTDNFTTIQCKITNSSGTRISVDSYVQLKEGASASSRIDILDGYLTIKTVYFKFRGNTNKSAKAVVSYNAM